MTEFFEATATPYKPGEWMSCRSWQGHMVLTRSKEPLSDRILHLFECDSCGVAQVMTTDKNARDPIRLRWVLNAIRQHRT